MSDSKLLYTDYFTPSNDKEGLLGDYFFKPPLSEGVWGRLLP
jgi:hypothetical protein